MSEPIAATIYSNQLINQKEGYPVWEPDPRSEPTVEIADVGYFKNGAFVRLFNASKEPGNASNKFGAPESYIPLEIGAIQERNSLPAHVPIQSESVMQRGAQATLSAGAFIQAGGGFSFDCSKQEGAVLILGDDADRRDALRLPPFFQYMRKHYSSWLTFANEVQQRGIALNDLILVTGCDLTSAWACAAFSGRSNQAALSFQVGPVGIAQGGISIWGTWSNCSSVAARSGPRRRPAPTVSHINPPHIQSPGDYGGVQLMEGSRGVIPSSLPLPPRNQCIFLRGYRICDKQTMLARLFIRKKKKPAYDGFYYIPRDKKDEEDPDSSGPSGGKTAEQGGSGAGSARPGSSTRSPGTGGAGPSGSESRNSGQSEEQSPPSDDSLSEEYLGDPSPFLDKEPTAFDFLFEYILDSSSAKVAIVHDNDLITLLQGAPHITDFGRWIQTLAPNVTVDHNQIGMLETTYRLLASESHDLKHSSPLATRPERVIARPDEGKYIFSSSIKERHSSPRSHSLFYNLNTIQYSGIGGAPLRNAQVLPRKHRSNGELRLQVTGPGLSPLPRHDNTTGELDRQRTSTIYDLSQMRSGSAPKLNSSRNYVCQDCGIGFDRISAYNSHMVLHDGEGLLLCSISGCSKRFRTRANMLRHERTHTAFVAVEENEYSGAGLGPSPTALDLPRIPRPQEALQIGSLITQQHPIALQDHRSTGNDQRVDLSKFAGYAQDTSRRYVCDDCGQRFDRPIFLDTHRRTHTGGRPFTCGYPGCGKTFAVRSNAHRHERTHKADAAFNSGAEGPSPSSSTQPSSSATYYYRTSPK